MNDDVATWGAWLRGLHEYVNDPTIFIPLLFIGTALLAFAYGSWLAAWKQRQASTQPTLQIDHVEHLTINQTGGIKTAEFEIPELSQHPQRAFIRFKPKGMFVDEDRQSLMASFNISSVVDDGIGEFTFIFAKPLNEETLVAHPVGTTRRFSVTSVSSGSISLKFDEPEPDEIAIRFDAIANGEDED